MFYAIPLFNTNYIVLHVILLFNAVYFHRLEEISGAASKEYSLEKAMEKMKMEWKDMLFEFVAYRDTVRTYTG